jgi:hypothetical protein
MRLAHSEEVADGHVDRHSNENHTDDDVEARLPDLVDPAAGDFCNLDEDEIEEPSSNRNPHEPGEFFAPEIMNVALLEQSGDNSHPEYKGHRIARAEEKPVNDIAPSTPVVGTHAGLRIADFDFVGFDDRHDAHDQQNRDKQNRQNRHDSPFLQGLSQAEHRNRTINDFREDSTESNQISSPRVVIQRCLEHSHVHAADRDRNREAENDGSEKYDKVVQHLGFNLN